MGETYRATLHTYTEADRHDMNCFEPGGTVAEVWIIGYKTSAPAEGISRIRTERFEPFIPPLDSAGERGALAAVLTSDWGHSRQLGWHALWRLEPAWPRLAMRQRGTTLWYDMQASGNWERGETVAVLPEGFTEALYRLELHQSEDAECRRRSGGRQSLSAPGFIPMFDRHFKTGFAIADRNGRRSPEWEQA